MSRRNKDRLIDDAAKLTVLLAVVAYLRYPWFREHWPLFVAAAAGLLVAWVVWRIWWRRRTAEMLLTRLAFADRTRGLSPVAFEEACAALFAREGYRASVTPPSGDDGVDIILRKDGAKSIAQCKHWPDGSVGAPEVRELLGAKQDFGAVQAFMVTSGFFTGPARELARRNEGLVLWDGETLRGLASRLMLRDVAREMVGGGSVAGSSLEPATEKPVCPRCGEDLVVRDGRYGRFMGCTGFPQCRYTRDVTEADEGV